MLPDGYKSWKDDTSKNLKKRDFKATPVKGTEGRADRAQDRQQGAKQEVLREKRRAALDNPFAPQPGHPPTARQVSLGADPSRGGVNYKPPTEKGGKKIWDGQRSSLGFSSGVADTIPDKDKGCHHQKPGCTGGADGIDHLDPFSERQSGLTRYLICDGRNHFEACLKEEAQEMYDAYPLVWSCTKCNSSKGGKKGLYENPPQFKEACPGDDCEVPAGGEAVG